MQDICRELLCLCILLRVTIILGQVPQDSFLSGENDRRIQSYPGLRLFLVGWVSGIVSLFGTLVQDVGGQDLLRLLIPFPGDNKELPGREQVIRELDWVPLRMIWIQSGPAHAVVGIP